MRATSPSDWIPSRQFPGGKVPDRCELCGAPAYGFTVAPLLRTCKSCIVLPMLDLVHQAEARGIDTHARMMPVEAD